MLSISDVVGTSKIGFGVFSSLFSQIFDDFSKFHRAFGELRIEK